MSPTLGDWGAAGEVPPKVGDWLICQNQRGERIESIDRIDAPARTVAIRVPGTNTYLAEGVWVHNDMANDANASGVAQETAHSGASGSVSHHSGTVSGSHASSSHSSSGKHSGSSFHSSSHQSESGHTFSA